MLKKKLLKKQKTQQDASTKEACLKQKRIKQKSKILKLDKYIRVHINKCKESIKTLQDEITASIL